MKHLNKPGDNMGGLIKIWAVPASDFLMNGTDVSFSSQDNIYEMYCSPDSMDFTENSEITPAGTHYNTTINGFIPQDNVALEEALAYIQPRKWVVIFMDGNENYKLAGSAFEPLRVNIELNTGKETANRAGCEIQFYGKTKARAVFINKPF